MKRESRRALCTFLALLMAVQPTYQTLLWASAFGILNSPLAALAQSLPPSAPSGAAEGKAFGESLLHGPSTDGGKIYFNGKDSTESIDTTDLFQSAGSADDVEAMMEAFGDDNAAATLSTAVAERLGAENSQQANAVRTVRESALSRSHPDLGNDPIFNRSKEIMDGDDPIFDTFFEGCESVDVPISGKTTTHVADMRYCSRVITPNEHCEIAHDYDVGLVTLIGGEGGMQSCGEGCLDLYVGRVGDNYWTGNCSVYEQDVQLQIDNFAAIQSAVLAETRWDDHMQIFIDTDKIWQGPNSNQFPPETPGRCELRTNWTQFPNVDLTPRFQKNGILKFKIRVSVSDHGEGYARIRILYDTGRAVTRDQWTISPECNALLEGLSDEACSLTSMQCLDGPAMDVPCLTVKGFEICQDDLSAGPIPGYSPLCRRGEINGNCRFMTGPMECWTDPNGVEHCPTNDGNNPNGCAIFEDDPKCGFVSSSCLPFAQGETGRCYAFEEKWDCGTDVELPGGTASHVRCDGPIRCMGEECVSPTREVNPDFGKAAATLTAMTFMAMETNCADGNPDNCTIFAGEPMECKSALGGYQDCCNTPVSVGLSDYLRLTMASYDLAKKLELGTKLANAGLNIPGAWNAIKNFTSVSWSSITAEFTTPWGSMAQSYGGQVIEGLEKFGLDALKKEMTKATAEFVADTFGPEVAKTFFGGAVDKGTGEFVANGALSDGFAAVMNVIAWVYAIYLILNILIDIVWACEEKEFMLAARREMQSCTYVGTYCKDDTAFGCIEKRTSYCCYNSPLARIVMEGAAPQLSLEHGSPETPNCEGLTIAQVAALDWNEIDLDQWYGILAANDVLPKDVPEFENRYALDNVTRNQMATFPAPSAPERIQNQVEAAQYFDEAREKIREDLWDGAE